MTPEEKELLERTYKLVEENNSILISIRRGNRISTAMRVIYWLVILGFSFGAYYLIQPYLNFLTGITGIGNDKVQSIQGIPGSLSSFQNGLQDLLK